MTERLNNEDIKVALTSLRDNLRQGKVTVYFRATGPQALRNAVAHFLGLQDADSFNTENFNPQTLKRWASLFDVPRWPQTAPTAGAAWVYPSQDDTATALQNFINRRARPWSHVEDITATAAETGVAVNV